MTLTYLEIRWFHDSFQIANNHAFPLVFTNTKRTNGTKFPFFRAFHVIFLVFTMLWFHPTPPFFCLFEDESNSTSAYANNKQIKALKRQNSIGVGATNVALIFFLQERRRCDIILTYLPPDTYSDVINIRLPQGRVILIVLMYINSPSLGEGRSGSELCRPYRARKLQILNRVALPHYPIICRPGRTYKKFFRELQ